MLSIFRWNGIGVNCQSMVGVVLRDVSPMYFSSSEQLSVCVNESEGVRVFEARAPPAVFFFLLFSARQRTRVCESDMVIGAESDS